MMKKYNRIKNIKKYSALTITELMVDLLLSSLVITALVGMYINYKTIYSNQLDNIAINQNAKSAYNFIKDDLQLTGFYGCESTKDNLEYAITPSFDYQLENPISAFEANQTGLNSTINLNNPSSGWNPTFDGQIAFVSPDRGSDALTIRYADSNPTAVLTQTTTGSTLNISTPEISISSGEILLISDCMRTVVFQVASIENNIITPTSTVGTLSANAEIYKININSYYIKTVDGIASLYKLANGTESLLVPYIENMQLLYGQDTNGDGITDKFNIAGNLTDKDITAIEIGLLIRSSSKHLQTRLNYNYTMLESPAALNTTITINANNDNYIRKSFNFNVAIMNI